MLFFFQHKDCPQNKTLLAIYLIKNILHIFKKYIDICLLIIIFRKLSLDLVPRTGPLAVDPHKIGIVSLHQVHVNSAENATASSVKNFLLASLLKILILKLNVHFILGTWNTSSTNIEKNINTSFIFLSKRFRSSNW